MENALDFLDAVKAGDLAKVRALLETSPELVQVRDEAGISAIMLATYYGQADVAEELAQLHIELDIFEAAALGRAERVAELLDLYPSLATAYSSDSFTALGLAAFFGKLHVAEILLAHGADVNAASRNAMRVRPLHSAVANRKLEVAQAMAELLIRHGAEVSVAQHGGWTPLHQAAAHGHLPLVKLLLAHGADPAARSEDGKTPGDMARDKGHAEVARLLAAEPEPLG